MSIWGIVVCGTGFDVYLYHILIHGGACHDALAWSVMRCGGWFLVQTTRDPHINTKTIITKQQ